MKINNIIVHRQEILCYIEYSELKKLIIERISEISKIDINQLIEHGKVTILEVTEGSPPYKVGYRAKFDAEIPLEKDWTNA